MRIVHLSAGTGSYYCGSCMRDNALTVALRQLGHDAIMVPLYLEPILDEARADSETPLFYGGVNVYLQQKSAFFRNLPKWLDRPLDSPALLRGVAKLTGMTRANDLGEMTLSMLRGEEGRQSKELSRLTDWLAREIKPDVVCLSNALLVGMARRIKETTGAVVACVLQGEDTFLDSLPDSFRDTAWKTLSERCRDIDVFLPVSRYYGERMRKRAGLPEDRMHVLYCGISLDDFKMAETLPNPPAIGYFARMSRTKGLHALVEAYLLLRQRGSVPNLKLRIAGTRTPEDESFIRSLRDRIALANIEDDVEFHPNVTRAQKIEFLSSLTVFSVPATYGESFGLYVIEAMAAGVPVVQPDHAAFPEIIAETEGGLLFKPEDPIALADALESLLLDPERARAMGERGRESVHRKFNAETMARETIRIFESIR